MTARLARHLLAACVLGLLASPTPPGPGRGLPPVPGPGRGLPPVPIKSLPVAVTTRLSLWVGGGIFPPNYFVALEGDALTYRVEDLDRTTGQPVESTETIRPSPERWREFWRSMDEVGFWRWRPVYEDPRMADGTHWSVEAAQGGRSIRSRGQILFPGLETLAEVEAPRDPASKGPLFDRYLGAVEKLLGGRPFR